MKEDAIPFGYYDGKLLLLVGKHEYDHSDLLHMHKIPNKKRNDLKFAGRLWYNHRILSFWGTYPTRSELTTIIKDIKKAIKNYPVDMNEPNSTRLCDMVLYYMKEFTINSETWRIDAPDENNAAKIILLKDYKNTVSKFDDVEHVKPPSVKIRKVIPGAGSDKRPAGIPHSQYHQIIRTSENNGVD